ncbi:MAG: RNA-guided endonuclease IscB [bacterium]|nr:RNA-guided endonuclease IscB [bacterium]
MQKLLEELKNPLRDASQVPNSGSSVLNKEKTLSVPSKVLANNNPDVNRLGNRRKHLTLVFVLNKSGKALMPCSPRKARVLLENRRAKVVTRCPFTIQLLYGSSGYKQPITLGIDSGFKTIGFSAVNSSKELLTGEVKLRTDVSAKLTERRMYRKQKRNKLWYRKPRWSNRTSTKKKGWLAPSIKHKLDAHLSLIERIKKLLPISNIIIEVASFDTQKMVNSEISGVEYQQGELQGYEIREYLLEKWGRKCAYCGKTDIPLEIEHIIPKSRGGSNRVFNLTISCNKCNQKKSNKTAIEFGHPEVQKQAKESLKATAFMNTVRWKLVNMLGCKWTYGYITKHNRIKLGLGKSHSNDAFVIAGGTEQERAAGYSVSQHRRNNRCLQLNRKGFKPSIRRRRYKLQPHSLVKYLGKTLAIKGVCHYGEQVLLENKKYISAMKVKLLKFGEGINFWRYAIPLTPKGVSPLA